MMGGNQGGGGGGGGEQPQSQKDNQRQWLTETFRHSMARKLEEAIRSSGNSTDRKAEELEREVFSRANTKEEYLGYVARLILHVRQQGGREKARRREVETPSVTELGELLENSCIGVQKLRDDHAKICSKTLELRKQKIELEHLVEGKKVQYRTTYFTKRSEKPEERRMFYLALNLDFMIYSFKILNIVLS